MDESDRLPFANLAGRMSVGNSIDYDIARIGPVDATENFYES
jgi:hypothetical protein